MHHLNKDVTSSIGIGYDRGITNKQIDDDVDIENLLGVYKDKSEISETETATLMLSHRMKSFPGLKDSLKLVSNIEIIDLDELKASESAFIHRDQIIENTGSVSHITQIDTGGAESPQQKEPTPSQPTHVLWRNEATAIGTSLSLASDLSKGPELSKNPAITIYTRNDKIMLKCSDMQGVKINGNEPDLDTPLQPGDQIEMSGDFLTLISVLKNG